MPSNVSQILYGDLQAASLTLTGSDGFTITAATGSESASHAVFKQYLSSSAGTIKGNVGFGIKNEFYGSLNNNYPAPYYATQYTVENTTAGRIKKTDYLASSYVLKAFSEDNNFSSKRFSILNSNFTQRSYVFSATTTAVENVYMGIGDIPSIQYISMPDQESWNFTLRIIARRSNALASDAFFIQGFCDNYGVGTINGQMVMPIEIGSPGLAPYLGAIVIFDQDGGNNNYFRIQCQSGLADVISWVGYLDIVSTYASASARPGGAGSI
jgi:hypothetical protein